MLSVSERLSSIKLKAPIQFLDGLFLYTQHTPKKYVASCTTSVYVNLSKNSFFLPPSLKAGAKVQTFFEPPKLFQENFHFLSVLFPLLDKSQDSKHATHY
jgi:hypothetical protein